MGTYRYPSVIRTLYPMAWFVVYTLGTAQGTNRRDTPMSMSAKIAGLSVVTLPVVGLTQFHYVVSHLSQIATGAAAITVGAAVWGGHALVGKVEVRNEAR